MEESEVIYGRFWGIVVCNGQGDRCETGVKEQVTSGAASVLETLDILGSGNDQRDV